MLVGLIVTILVFGVLAYCVFGALCCTDSLFWCAG